MLDAVAIGETFTPPTVESFYEAFRAASAGRGVLCLCGNYPKDLANVTVAMKQAAAEQIEVRLVVANDDVAYPDPSVRRGMLTPPLFDVGGSVACRSAGVPAGAKLCLVPAIRHPQSQQPILGRFLTGNFANNSPAPHDDDAVAQPDHLR